MLFVLFLSCAPLLCLSLPTFSQFLPLSEISAPKLGLPPSQRNRVLSPRPPYAGGFLGSFPSSVELNTSLLFESPSPSGGVDTQPLTLYRFQFPLAPQSIFPRDTMFFLRALIFRCAEIQPLGRRMTPERFFLVSYPPPSPVGASPKQSPYILLQRILIFPAETSQWFPPFFPPRPISKTAFFEE